MGSRFESEWGYTGHRSLSEEEAKRTIGYSEKYGRNPFERILLKLQK